MKRATGKLAALAAVVALAGCGGGEKTGRELSERQRDSVIATEKALPGSDVVGRALATSDSAAARARSMDTAGEDGGGSADEGK